MFPFSAKDFPHPSTPHTNFFSPVCVLKWAFNVLIRPNFFSQKVQLNFLIFKCWISMWAFKCPLVLYVLGQFGHLKGLCSEWNLWWVFRLPFSLKALPHSLQMNGFVPAYNNKKYHTEFYSELGVLIQWSKILCNLDNDTYMVFCFHELSWYDCGGYQELKNVYYIEYNRCFLS